MVLSVVSIGTTSKAEAASKSTYWLKVNRTANVVNVYKKNSRGQYVPYRVMLASCGAKTSPTIGGNHRVGSKQRWGALYGNVWGQYMTQIHRDYLFHSVYYYGRNNHSLSYKEFNRLGTNRSMGCVRLCTMDAKWIYENCPRGTKITVYSSKNPGPLGKPKGYKTYRGWDPTDPSRNNPYYKLKKPVITISSRKAKTIQYGQRYSLKSYVIAKNVNVNQNLTSRISIGTKKYSSVQKKYYKRSLSTKVLGTYRITYKVYDKYSGTTYKYFYVRVIDTVTPTITASDRTVAIDSTNAVYNVTAKQPSRSLTSNIKVSVKAPGETEYGTSMTYEEAKNYTFANAGVYSVKYTVKNIYSPYRTIEKIVNVTCEDNAEGSI